MIVNMPDGTPVNFPDDMPRDQIKGLIASKYPDVVSKLQETAKDKIAAYNFPKSGMETLQKIQQDPSSIPNAAVRGFAQGYTGGLGDELSGVMNPTNYQDTRNQQRQLNKVADSKYPNLYNASEMLGMGISPISKFGAAPAGAIMGYGFSNSSDPLQQTADVGIGSATAKAGEVAFNGMGKIANKVGSALTPKELPQNLQNLQPLLDAKGGIFSKSPNALQSGLNANQKISQAYDAAKTRTAAADSAARQEGGAPIPAADVYSKLNNIIGSLEGKLAPGTKEAGALDQLTQIRNNLNEKNPIVQSSAGEKVQERSILPSDLMDIERTINAGLPDNKLITSGAGKSLSFKKTVQDALLRAGEQNPAFADKYANYKSEATNLMRTYNNDSIRNFWQPEDHIAWKANQNNPSQPSYTDDTLTRANKLLDNLNTKDTGKLSAVIKALPPEEAQSVINDVLVRAKKEQVSLPNAIRKIVTLNPTSGIETAAKLFNTKPGVTNIEATIKNLQKMLAP